MRLRVGPRPQQRHLQVPVIAFVLELLLGPSPEQDPLSFFQARLSLVVVDAEALVIVNIVRGAAAKTDNQPPLGNVVEDANCSARRIGWCSAVCTTAKPILLWRVEVASAPAKLIGST